MCKNHYRIILLFSIIFFILPSLFCETVKYKDEIKPYVSFLQEQKKSPVDYVMDLFSRYDIVILCERYHMEITQYDMIYELVSDSRFINSVGNIFTEIGTSTNNNILHDFLFAEGLSENQIEARALNIYRNLSWMALWEKYNLFPFIIKLHKLNNSLSADRKINLYFSDVPFSWEGMTKEKYQDFLKEDAYGKRDQIMAQQIISKFHEIRNSVQKRKKALVIMNYRHAFNDFTFSDGYKGDNVGRYLFEEFPGQVSNILINSIAPILGSTNQQWAATPIHDGKWDAAFEITGNPNLGFDFNGSPFGEDDFDYFPYRKTDMKYKNVFTGFIFYKPLKEHKLVVGIPHLFDDGYDKIILNREEIAGHPVKEVDIKEYLSDWGNKREFKYEDVGTEYKAKIDSWLSRYKNP